MCPANRGRNISIIAILSNVGIFKYRSILGAYNANSFLEFLCQCSYDIAQTFPNSYLIMDNAKFHHSQNVTAFLEEEEIRYKFLPPYSPQLNPIEECFSAFKSRLHKVSPKPTTTSQLISCVDSIFAAMNSDLNFENFYQHMREYVQKAYNRQAFS